MISENGINLIKDFERCILQSYDDYNEKILNVGDTCIGTLTIGYGHTENVYIGQTITQEQAEQMLKDDMEIYSAEVDEIISLGIINFPLSQNSYDALVSFDYNCGQDDLIKLVSGRDKQTIADKMLLYINKGSVWEKGLLKRRNIERNLFLSDDLTHTVNVENNINDEVARLQNELNVQGFKDKNGNILKVDGKVGELTLSACPLIKKGSYGNITQWVQLRVGVEPDKNFGDETEKGVKYFQRSRLIADDGEVGQITWKNLFQVMGVFIC